MAGVVRIRVWHARVQFTNDLNLSLYISEFQLSTFIIYLVNNYQGLRIFALMRPSPMSLAIADVPTLMYSLSF